MGLTLAITMGVLAAGSTVASSMAAGQSAANQVKASENQQNFADFTARMNLQKKNRQIAKKNAAMWQMNKNIAKAANETRAEEEFWIQYNFDNSADALSRQTKQTNDSLLSQFERKGVGNSQSAKQVLKMALDRNKQSMIDQRIQVGNKMVMAKRKQDDALARRNFGYGGQTSFQPGQTVSPDPGDIMNAALLNGLVQGAFAGATTGVQTGIASKQAGIWK